MIFQKYLLGSLLKLEQPSDRHYENQCPSKTDISAYKQLDFGWVMVWKSGRIKEMRPKEPKFYFC